MGGRGARSGGRSGRAPNGYRTIGKIGSIKIIRNNTTGKGLPTKAHTKNAKYFGTDGSGKINQMRIFDKHGNPKQDIDWTHNFRINGKSYPKGTIHFHSWKNGRRIDDHKLPTPQQKRKYKSIIDRMNQGEQIKWE